MTDVDGCLDHSFLSYSVLENVVTRCSKKLSSKIDQSDLDGIWEASKVNLLAKLAQRVHGNFSDPKLPKLKFATRREKWILQARLVP